LSGDVKDASDRKRDTRTDFNKSNTDTTPLRHTAASAWISTTNHLRPDTGERTRTAPQIHLCARAAAEITTSRPKKAYFLFSVPAVTYNAADTNVGSLVRAHPAPRL
jgi:hypothetical protein